MSLIVDPTINFALIGGMGTALVSMGIVLGGARNRLFNQEERQKKTDIKVELIEAGMLQLSEAISATRFDMIKGFAPLEYMRVVERKIDNLSDESSKIASTQAAQGATLKGMAETLRDLKARP